VVTPARRVFAQPGTITGSIGVISGKLAAGGLFDQLLFHREQVVRGRHATMFGPDAAFSDEERAQLRGLIEHTYAQFIDRVAKARGMSSESVDAVGGGRVWSGRQALERGLVDEMGGVAKAVGHARSLAGLPESAPLREVAPGRGWAPPPAGAASALAFALEAARALNSSATWLLFPLVSWY
jgi:protease-4